MRKRIQKNIAESPRSPRSAARAGGDPAMRRATLSRYAMAVQMRGTTRRGRG